MTEEKQNSWRDMPLQEHMALYERQGIEPEECHEAGGKLPGCVQVGRFIRNYYKKQLHFKKRHVIIVAKLNETKLI